MTMYPSKNLRDHEFESIVAEYFDTRMINHSYKYLKKDLLKSMPYIVLRFNTFFKTPMKPGDIEWLHDTFKQHIKQYVKAENTTETAILYNWSDSLNDLVDQLTDHFAANLPDYQTA